MLVLKRTMEFSTCSSVGNMKGKYCMKTSELKIKEIKKIFEINCCWNWTEVFIQSMYENEERYIAKAVFVDTNEGKYRDIYFKSVECTKRIAKRNGKMIDSIIADSEGKTIDEAITNLLQLIDNLMKADYYVYSEGL